MGDPPLARQAHQRSSPAVWVPATLPERRGPARERTPDESDRQHLPGFEGRFDSLCRLVPTQTGCVELGIPIVPLTLKKRDVHVFLWALPPVNQGHCFPPPQLFTPSDPCAVCVDHALSSTTTATSLWREKAGAHHRHAHHQDPHGHSSCRMYCSTCRLYPTCHVPVSPSHHS